MSVESAGIDAKTVGVVGQSQIKTAGLFASSSGLGTRTESAGLQMFVRKPKVLLALPSSR